MTSLILNKPQDASQYADILVVSRIRRTTLGTTFDFLYFKTDSLYKSNRFKKLPWLIHLGQRKNTYYTVNFSNIRIKFNVTLVESHSQHFECQTNHVRFFLMLLSHFDQNIFIISQHKHTSVYNCGMKGGLQAKLGL